MSPGDKKDKRALAQLVKQAQNNHPEAFAALYQLYYRDICYYVQLRAGNDITRAEDVAQEAFLQAFKKIGQLRDPKKFSAWIYQIANRTLLNVQRNEQRHNLALGDEFSGQEDLVADPGPLPEELAQHRERCELVADCLQQMSSSRRLLLLLRYEADLNATEIATILELSPGTVRNQLVDARRELKTLLQKCSATRDILPLIWLLLPGASLLSRAIEAVVMQNISTVDACSVTAFLLPALTQAPG
ncbi:MAG: RNA polymerase sigma factor [Actinomycetia bacterium]|nr:RNA polymerase sigma factor [Actinomycetes bacterium]